MLDAVFFLGALCVVETVERSYEITRNSSDTLKRNVREMIFHIHEIPVKFKVNRAEVLIRILNRSRLNIIINLFAAHFSAGNINVNHFNHLNIL